MKKDIQIKQCPFCGEMPEIHTHRLLRSDEPVKFSKRVRCNNPKCLMPDTGWKQNEKAVKMWNTRY